MPSSVFPGGCLFASVLQAASPRDFLGAGALLEAVIKSGRLFSRRLCKTIERTKLTQSSPTNTAGARRCTSRCSYAEAHPGASADLELVQSLWIQEVPKK